MKLSTYYDGGVVIMEHLLTRDELNEISRGGKAVKVSQSGAVRIEVKLGDEGK